MRNVRGALRSGSDARALDGILDDFVGADRGRSIAITVPGEPQWSCAREGDAVRPAASLLKLAVVLAIFRAAQRGAADLNDRVHRRDLPRSRFAGVIDVFDEDHVFTLRELCGLALATSDNPIANHLVALTGFSAVNQVLEDIGCTNSQLVTGFADEHLGPTGRSNESSAHDMLLILEHIRANANLRPVLNGMTSSLRNSRIPLRMPDDGTVRIAHKTGSLEGVVNDAGIVEGQGHTLLVAVLCDDQVDSAATSTAIGDCVFACWTAVAGSPAP